MTLSRSPFGFGFLLSGLLSLGLAADPSLGQPAPKAAPSPVAPGDLSRPVFDTKTPVYDSVASLDKAASMVVAEVEGRPITMGEVGDVIRALPGALAQSSFDTLFPGVVDQLVKQQALVVRAQQQGLDEEPAVRRRVRAAADKQLAEEYLRREIGKGITEKDLLDLYNREIAGRPGPEEAKLRVIMTETEKEAAALIAEVRGGADFAAVARRSSKDSTAPEGGDLGFKTREELNPQIAAVAFALSVGQVVSYPVRGADAWFVLKLEERRVQPAPSFPAVRKKLSEALLKQGVMPLTEAALTGLKVRKYNLLGEEIDVSNPEAR